MTPLLPGELKFNLLRPLAAQVISEAKELSAQGMPHLRNLLRETLRPMNSFYTNKIEGQHTEPLLIARALNKDFSKEPDEARRQRIAIAHIQTERSGEAAYPLFNAKTFFSPQVVQAIHAHLHSQLSSEDLIQTFIQSGTQEQTEIVKPGQWREHGVVVGKHIAPDPNAIPSLMEAWQAAYQYAVAGENALIALMAAHHRLTWIHPFIDGNGRSARLHTHLGLAALGLTQGLWSPMRGLARAQNDYYLHLAQADQPRQGDYDGRGVLSENALVASIEFLMKVCLDQIQFMGTMLDMGHFEARLCQLLAASATKVATKALKLEAAAPLTYLATVPSLERNKFKGMMGLASRTADRVLADLFTLGIV
ncbi:MAG: Fic family protein, partial [Undibacterium sp.]|nr:Fic family protein [Undibacterium sp.]